MTDAEQLAALAARLTALEARVLELESRPTPAWLHSVRRDGDRLIAQVISEPIDEEPLRDEPDLT